MARAERAASTAPDVMFRRDRMTSLSKRLPNLALTITAKTADRALTGFIVALLLLASALLALPGRTVSAIYGQDLMVYLDGAHRLLAGQVPNGDFHTPLGPLAYLLPAFGLWATQSLGATMPVASVAFVLLVTPILLYLCRSRLPAPLAIIVAIYLILLAIAPLNPGEPYGNISFGMFYNRICWVAIDLLFLLAVPAGPGSNSNAALDAAAGAALLLVLIYTKINYAVLGAAFLVLLVLVSRTRRMAMTALAGAAVCSALIYLVWPHIGAYLKDILLAAEASGVVRNGVRGLAGAVLRNIQPIGLLLVIVVVAVTHGLRAQILAMCGFMLAAGLLLINQNSQEREIATLLPAAVLALLGAGVSISMDGRDWRGWIGVLLVALIALPNAAQAAAALVAHARKAAAPQASASITAVGDLIAFEEPRSGIDWPVEATLHDIYAAGSANLRQINLTRSLGSRQILTQPEYLWTVRDGIALLRSHPELGGTIWVLDMSNPFSALLSRRPPRGDSSWHHFGRTFSDTVFIAPERMLADVSVVMEPKDPVALATAIHLKRVYGGHLQAHFRPVAESTYWRAYVRKQSD